MDPLYLALLLYGAAVVLAFVDLFIPSGGLLLILASTAAFASILFGFRSSTTTGMTMLTVVAASIPLFTFAAIKIWPNTPLGKRIILGLPGTTTASTTTESDPLELRIGMVVKVDFALMPTGQLQIGHRYYNAVAESGIIEAGQNVEIVAVRDRNYVVRPTEAMQTPIPAAKSDIEDPSLEDLLERPADEIGLESLDE